MITLARALLSRMVDEEQLEILAHEKIEETYTVQKYIEEEETENDNGGGSSKFDDQIEGKEGNEGNEGKEGNEGDEGKEGEGKQGTQGTMIEEVVVRIRGIQPTLFELQLNDNNAKAEGAAAIFGIAGAMQELQVLSLNKNNIDASLLASYATKNNTDATATNKDHKHHKDHKHQKHHKHHKHSNSAVAHKDLRHRGSIGNLGRNHLHRHVHHTEASNRIRAPICQGISMMIEKHTSLTALHLNNNKLGDAGATSIGNALAHNSVLTDLQLNW